MPQIRLKPASPDYDATAVQAAAAAKPYARRCDMPGCPMHADHRAPKDRSLSNYHWFCFDHVQEYNAAWNFFAGMADQDIEKHVVESLYGDRPTWRSDHYRGLEADLHDKIHQTRYFTDGDDEPAKPQKPTGNPELDALRTLGFAGPVDFDTIKKRYRALVKQHHPDHHAGDSRAEDLLKSINMAYTILKMAYASQAA